MKQVKIGWVVQRRKEERKNNNVCLPFAWWWNPLLSPWKKHWTCRSRGSTSKRSQPELRHSADAMEEAKKRSNWQASSTFYRIKICHANRAAFLQSVAAISCRTSWSLGLSRFKIKGKDQLGRIKGIVVVVIISYFTHTHTDTHIYVNIRGCVGPRRVLLFSKKIGRILEGICLAWWSGVKESFVEIRELTKAYSPWMYTRKSCLRPKTLSLSLSLCLYVSKPTFYCKLHPLSFYKWIAKPPSFTRNCHP